MESNGKKRGSNGHVPIAYTPLPSPYKEKAELLFGENEETAVRCIEQLRKKILCDGDFKCPLDESFLLKYLRFQYFNVEDAYDNIKCVFHCNTKWPSLYNFDKKSLIDKVLGSGFFQLLPNKDASGAPVIAVLFENFDANTTSSSEIMDGFFFLCDYLMRDPINQVSGVTVINDYRNFSAEHLKRLTLPHLQKAATGMSNGKPFRIQSIYICHLNPFAEIFLDIFLKLLPQKERVKFHLYGEDLQEFHSVFSKEDLLPEFGGTLKLNKYHLIQTLKNI